ncbi:condensin complex subunit 2-like [Amphiura filiformis]|uniref:condensin complex subunit 2-like n=1 Tax=Amphiura filiformis TaxID=82378 RepID=UPI003B20F9CA
MPTAPDLSTPTGQVGSFQRHISSSSGTPAGSITPKNFISPTTSSRRPRGVLTSVSNVLSYTAENDDAAEKKQRRRSQVLVMQRQYESPGTPQDRRRSLPTSGMSNAQLSDHYANCIKLSAENKINAKNAFGLHLIDHMAEVLKEKKGELNFQVASCTLDASAKIYAGRVDAIHAETYKIMGGLGHGDKHKGGDDGEGSQEMHTKKKKRRHCNTIEANIKNLNCNKIDPGFEVDPFFHKMSAAFDEGGTFGLLLNHLHRRGDCSELVLDSRCSLPTSVDTDQKDQSTQTNVDLKEFKDVFSAGANRMESLQVCPQFADFEFTKWNQDGEDTFSTMMSKLASSEQAFDVHAAPEPLEDPMMHMDNFAGPPPDADDFSDDDMAGDMTCIGGAGEASMFIADGSEAKMMRSGCTSASTTNGSASQLCLQMSLEPTEYSYFNMKALSTWAGPQHWNFRPRTQAATVGTEGKKTRTKKEPFRINFEVELDEKPFSTSRAATTLSKRTLSKYKQTSTMLPEDVHYNPDKLFKLFSKTNYIVKRQLGVSGTEVDDDVGGYDYDNANDCANFCPNTEPDDYDDDVGSGLNDFSAAPSDGSQTLGFSSHSFANESVFDATMLQGDKLVAQPHKVAKIDITYARTAKRVDVKRLKSLMWGHLITPKVEAEKENTEEKEPKTKENEMADDGVAGMQSFKDVYDSLPARLSQTMSKNLSVPIAFVCLLHLANEKCLKITRKEESQDLVIIQDHC